MNNLSLRFMMVCWRNFIVYRKTWMVSFVPPIMEPLFYLLAFGVGMSLLIGHVTYDGKLLSYTQFIAPALVAINIMNNAFYENTYGSFVRMHNRKTFEGIMATPLTVAEIIAGEIVWGACKAVFATIVMMIVISFFGLIQYPEGLLLIPLAFLGGLLFGSLAMCFTSVVPNIELFNLPIFLFIVPMYLFAGTFFPLQNLPLWIQEVAAFLPLTHLVTLCRAFAGGEAGIALTANIFYILCLTPVLFFLAIYGMHRRLIK